jgi:hypothetical protein
MVKRKKSVNILSDNVIYRPKLDDETNTLINDLNDEIMLLKCKIHELNDEIAANKKTKELESKPKPKKIYSIPMYPLYYMYIPVYPLYHPYLQYPVYPYPIYPQYPIVYYNYPLCH